MSIWNSVNPGKVSIGLSYRLLGKFLISMTLETHGSSGSRHVQSPLCWNHNLSANWEQNHESLGGKFIFFKCLKLIFEFSVHTHSHTVFSILAPLSVIFLVCWKINRIKGDISVLLGVESASITFLFILTFLIFPGWLHLFMETLRSVQKYFPYECPLTVSHVAIPFPICLPSSVLNRTRWCFEEANYELWTPVLWPCNHFWVEARLISD